LLLLFLALISCACRRAIKFPVFAATAATAGTHRVWCLKCLLDFCACSISGFFMNHVYVSCSMK
jgi:hypothetical protein